MVVLLGPLLLLVDAVVPGTCAVSADVAARSGGCGRGGGDDGGSVRAVGGHSRSAAGDGVKLQWCRCVMVAACCESDKLECTASEACQHALHVRRTARSSLLHYPCPSNCKPQLAGFKDAAHDLQQLMCCTPSGWTGCGSSCP